MKLSNLPPGVSDRMIEDQANGGDTRYPYTYACDFIRAIPAKADDGITVKLSRGDASLIRQRIAEVIGWDDEDLANALADAKLASD